MPRTVHPKRFEEQVAGTCPKNSNWFEFLAMGLVAGTKVQSQRLNGQFGTRWDLSKRLVAGTSSSVCVSTLKTNKANCIKKNRAHLYFRYKVCRLKSSLTFESIEVIVIFVCFEKKLFISTFCFVFVWVSH